MEDLMKAHLIMIAGLLAALSQQSANANEPVCDTSKMKTDTIEELRTALDENYIHREQIDALHTGLAAKFRRGAYDRAKTPSDFATQLSSDLIDLSQDYHFSVYYQPESASSDEPETSAEAKALFKEDALVELQRSNFGFQSLEILEGNIGYVRFDSFPGPLIPKAASTCGSFCFTPEANQQAR